MTEITTTVTTETAVAAKTPSKKSLALAIFNAKLVERSQGLFASNKDFRAAVLSSIQTELGVSVASAATMYNAAKAEAEKADETISLGRDPKKVKVKAEGGKRGRPAGSKNKAKVTVVINTTATTEAAEGAGYAEPTEAVAA